MMMRRLTSSRAWAYGLFWSWNIIFLTFMFLGFGPQLLPEMLAAVRAGTIPVAFLVYGAILAAIPALAVVSGALWLRRAPDRLFALGYGVEGPLMLMLALRFFLVHEITPGVALLMSAAGLGIATLLWQLLDRSIDRRGPFLTCLRVIGLTCLLLAGLYASVWIAFYAVPAADALARMLAGIPQVLRSASSWEWRRAPFWLLGALLLAYTATLFVLLPVAVPILYVRSWWRGVRALAARRRVLAAVVPAAVLTVCAALFVLTSRQPQHQAFALLKTPPSSPGEATALLRQQETIRAGLLNAYLAPQRYLSALGEVRHVSEMYRTLGLTTQDADRVQQLYEDVASPVLYDPVEPGAGQNWENQAQRVESGRAAELYEQFFDMPINDGERDAVVLAARSTWSVGQAQAAWQAVDDREILLTRQELVVAEHGDWADMELYEVYQNQTTERQEVVYYFSLPESAVITGVWLGNSPDRDRRFVYRVAPRGAAQSMYRSEVRYNRDPALVEQIGPRQYRLRVFPIEPRRWRWDAESERSTVEEAPQLHMWLTWRVLAEGDQWPLPRLADKRNVYWDGASTRLVDGAPMPADQETWLPAALPAASPAAPVAHRVDFPNGETVIARPATAEDRPRPAEGLRLAVVLDRSRSMARHSGEIAAALARLREIHGSAPADVYLTASAYRGEQPAIVDLDRLDPGSLIYYGGQNPAQLLAQFSALQAGRTYDAILVLTDDSSYELGPGDLAVSTPGAPVWMVHLGGFPLGYDDPTLTAIQASGGGVAGTVDEALTRLAIARAGGQGGPTQAPNGDIIDGYLRLTVSTGAAAPIAGGQALTHAPGDAFAAFAARRLILAAMQRQRAMLGNPQVLERLHATAIEHSIVTPFSSMIVLVNDEQRRRLDELEQRDDRFQREHEDVGETTPEPPTVTGVPEPEEWLLIGLAALMLLWYVRSSRAQAQRRQPVP
jgi:putative PEP-CTERM system integral membrane protein